MTYGVRADDSHVVLVGRQRVERDIWRQGRETSVWSLATPDNQAILTLTNQEPNPNTAHIKPIKPVLKFVMDMPRIMRLLPLVHALQPPESASK